MVSVGKVVASSSLDGMWVDCDGVVLPSPQERALLSLYTTPVSL